MAEAHGTQIGALGSASLVPHAEPFRDVLSCLASGVVAVTARDTDGRPIGLTVSSFVSVSLEPPLVLFCVAVTSRTWPRMRTTDGICINILSEDQQGVSVRLATSGTEKFDDVAWTPSASGMPVLHGALTWLECTVTDEHPAGDHHIVVSRVDQVAPASAGGPLIRHRGRYVRLASPGAPKDACQ
ncbi:flavin reductase family protein [Streptomyces leeuwenhoekii]|uniref:Flavin-dependent monooxygenase, reductase subunit n=1 Tax=Streptomyces leeuwenhoekii TaxID=1437453 RepID=A0A0F7VN13_STRLW|nr:flavin reductase family protein [Streptomyces leeuwenhoekii]CQR59593.1 Flavin-dependent monooxygenase, reductase subunit [Streptomyces leeuwenhoekii]